MIDDKLMDSSSRLKFRIADVWHADKYENLADLVRPNGDLHPWSALEHTKETYRYLGSIPKIEIMVVIILYYTTQRRFSPFDPQPLIQ